MDLQEQARKLYEARQKEHQDRLKSDPAYREQIENVLNDPEIQKLRERAENARNFRGLTPGSPEAKEKGCICQPQEIRDEECELHGYTIKEMMGAAQKLADAE